MCHSIPQLTLPDHFEVIAAILGDHFGGLKTIITELNSIFMQIIPFVP